MSRKFNRILILVAALLALGLTVGMASCDSTSPEFLTTEAATEAATDAPTEPVTDTPATTEEITTEEETTLSIQDQLGLDVKDEDLKDIMQNIFGGTLSKNETVMFLEKGDVKSLLFPIKEIVSVTSYDGSKVYEEGVDYVVEDGDVIYFRFNV